MGEVLKTVKESCGNCIYARRTDELKQRVCLRFPPIPIGGIVGTQAGPQMMVQFQHPVTTADAWCGEHDDGELEDAGFVLPQR